MQRNKLTWVVLIAAAIYFGIVGGILIETAFPKAFSSFKSYPKSYVTGNKTVYTDCIYIPAVSDNKGVITRFCLNVLSGTGKVFISLPPFFEKESSVGFVFAKDAVCKLFDDCDRYSYLFYSNDVIYGEGLSGTAGFSLLILSFFEKHLKHKIRNHDYPITGFMLPNGVIAPVAGILQKINASLEVSNKLVAPTSGKHIVSAYTILDLLKIYFNETVNVSFSVPESYKYVIREIAQDMCKGISNETVQALMEKGDYYSAASYCFRIKSESYEVNYTDDQVNRMISRILSQVNNTLCYTYECKEIKYQVISRLKMAKKLNESKKYWRYYTATGWYKFFQIANQIDRKDTCSQIKRDYTAMRYLYPQLPNTTDCFEMREYLAKVYASLVTYRNETAFKSIERLIEYYFNRNGFSISAYSYLEYAKDLYAQGDKDSAFYYLLLSLEYAV